MNLSRVPPVSSRSQLTYEDRCAEALEVALERTSAYSSWRPRDPGPAAAPRERFAALPQLTKADLRGAGVEAFIPHGLSLERGLGAGEIELVHTSGTTGDRVCNIWYQPWWDASEHASWTLNAALAGAGLGSHREAILTSPHCAGFPCEDGYLDTTARRLGRFLFLNERSDPTSWTSDHMDRMVREIRVFAPEVLEANPSFLARLSRHLLARGDGPRVPHVVLTYETPGRTHLALARAALGVEPISSYGTTETGYVFMQCEAGRLHQNVRSCHVDFIPFPPEHGGPVLGRILVTTFANPWRSLVRFDVGDVVRLAPRCPCGRVEGLTLESIEGRVVNLTATTEGRAVTQAAVDRAVAPTPGLVEYRLIQTTRDRYEVSFVSDDGAERTRRVGRELVERLESVYGRGARVVAEGVDAIHPDPPGKYRPTRSLLSLDPDTPGDRRV